MNFGTVVTKREGKHVTLETTCQSEVDAEGLEAEVITFAENRLKQFAAKKLHEWNQQGACPLCGKLDDAAVHQIVEPESGLTDKTIGYCVY